MINDNARSYINDSGSLKLLESSLKVIEGSQKLFVFKNVMLAPFPALYQPYLYKSPEPSAGRVKQSPKYEAKIFFHKKTNLTKDLLNLHASLGRDLLKLDKANHFEVQGFIDGDNQMPPLKKHRHFYEGCYAFHIKSLSRPTLLNSDAEESREDDRDFYAGCIVNVVLEYYNVPNKDVLFTELVAVQKVDDIPHNIEISFLPQRKKVGINQYIDTLSGNDSSVTKEVRKPLDIQKHINSLNDESDAAKKKVKRKPLW